MTSDEQLNELIWTLGVALQHRAAMVGLHRYNPSVAAEEWVTDSRAEVRKLQARERRLRSAAYTKFAG